jgi:iron complex transport system ATP-binding protein
VKSLNNLKERIIKMNSNHLANQSAPLIEYQNITVVQSNRTKLDNLNLTIHPGEQVAVLGPNGAGKSSLLKTITREYYPVANKGNSYLRILGEEFWDIFELRSRLGIVHGDSIKSHFRDISCREMVLSSYFGSTGLWPYDPVTPEMEKKTTEVMKFLGIEHLAARDTCEISTGESRLILIGRALVHNPPAMLLDEPTASLDPHATHVLRTTLRRITAQDKSLIMITHDLGDIIPEIQRIILIRDGKVIGDGDKEKLLTTDVLYQLFDIKLEIVRRYGFYHCW